MTKAQMLVVKEFGVKPEDVRVVGSDVLFSAGDSEVRVSRCGFAESEYVCPLCGELDRFCACGDEY